MEETKFCPICKEELPKSKFSLNVDGSIRKHVCKRCYGAKYRAQLKLEMLEAFGWKCQCCGEDNPDFLTLDHILNDGNTHRADIGSGSVEVIYMDAKKEGWPKGKYQLLCMNCNWAKGKWGSCPHQEGRTAQNVIDTLRAKVFHTGKTLQNYVGNRGLALGPAVSAKSPNHKGFTAESSKKANEIKNVAGFPEKFKKLFAQLSPEARAKLLEKYESKPN